MRTAPGVPVRPSGEVRRTVSGASAATRRADTTAITPTASATTTGTRRAGDGNAFTLRMRSRKLNHRDAWLNQFEAIPGLFRLVILDEVARARFLEKPGRQ